MGCGPQAGWCLEENKGQAPDGWVFSPSHSLLPRLILSTRNFVLLEMKCLLLVTQLLSDRIRIYVFKKNLLLLFLPFGPYCVACGILVPWPGIKPMTPALAAQSLNHWTTREIYRIYVYWLPVKCFFCSTIYHDQRQIYSLWYCLNAHFTVWKHGIGCE